MAYIKLAGCRKIWLSSYVHFHPHSVFNMINYFGEKAIVGVSENIHLASNWENILQFKELN